MTRRPEREVTQYLDGLRAERAGIALDVLRNRENVGFVKTCNRAFRETRGDVVLLNSDTVVTEGWLDRLAAAAENQDVATVTPLTNFGSICTIPPTVRQAFDLDGAHPRIDACAAFVAEHSLRRRPRVISGVGFCMYITRAALDACGTFDAATFGAGYGEEVDFCLRASAAGFDHLVEDSTFVFHRGGSSFNERRAELLHTSAEILHARYPFFRLMNLRERGNDPLQVSFAALELGLHERDPERPHVLQVMHSTRGELGGTEKHVARLIDALSDEFDISVFRPAHFGFLLSTSWRSRSGDVVVHDYAIPGGYAKVEDVDDPAAATALRTALDMFDFDAVHLQNIVHHSLAPLDVLGNFSGPVVCSVRDLYLACPHHWLLYRNRQSCGLPEDLSYCATCLPETRGLDVAYLDAFRGAVSGRLGTVDHWVFASQSAADFFLRVYDLPPERVEVVEHGAIIEHSRPCRAIDEGRIFDEPLRIAFVGIGWAKKGLPIVNELAEAFAGTSIEFHHFGGVREPISPLIHAHGEYDNAVLPELLERAGIQVMLLPGPFVETFGHVLTEALITGLPVIGCRWGAIGERIRHGQFGWIIDPEDLAGICGLISHLDRSRLEILRATRRASEIALFPVSETAARYAALYRTSKSPPRRPTPRQGSASVQEIERLRRALRATTNVNYQLQAQLPQPEIKTARPHPPLPRPAPGEAAAGTTSPSPRAAATRIVRLRSAVRRHGIRGAAHAALRRLRLSWRRAGT